MYFYLKKSGRVSGQGASELEFNMKMKNITNTEYNDG